MQEVRIPYRQKPTSLFLMLFFFIACACVLAHKAIHNQEGLILNGIFEFSVVGASRFYWALVVFSVLFVLGGIGVFMHSFGANRELVFGATGLSCPQSGISSNIVQMNYADITDFYVHTVQKQRFLRVVCGKRQLSIPQLMMPSKEAFEGVVKLLEEKMRGL